ncbi:MAG: mechanosensitive ion channel [Candidatus Aenigmarchaeota archaeon]|nr:mechanosensitive ion channel [Candidatus Aenigmarchaeota archaeon]
MNITGYVIDVFNIAANSQYLYALFMLVAFVVAAKIISFMFAKILLIYSSKTKTDVDDKLANALKNPIYYVVIAAGIYFSVQSLGITGDAALYFERTIKSIITVIIAVGVSRVAIIFVESFGKGIAKKTKTTLDEEMLPLIKNLVRLLIVTLAVLQILSVWSIEITPILASAGIAGFAIAFAAKDTIGHVFGGMSIYADRTFKKGDRVVLPSGETAIVYEVGVRSTKFRTFNSSTIIIPNSEIANAKIENLSWPPGNKKVKITVGVDYDSDIDKVKKALLFVAKKDKTILKDPEPTIYFIEMGDSSLNFLLICHVKKIEDVFDTKDALNTAIIKKFRTEKINIPFPTRTVYNVK